MASMQPMDVRVVPETTDELERLEQQHPEWGRLEVIDGTLHATGDSAVSYLHQNLMGHLYLEFMAARPEGSLVVLDCWWVSTRGRIRADVALWRPEDIPANRKAFRVPPWATLEILSEDADHDLVTKDEIYREFGVTRRAYLEAWERYPWWLRLDGVDHAESPVTWQLDGWPPLTFDRDRLMED